MSLADWFRTTLGLGAPRSDTCIQKLRALLDRYPRGLIESKLLPVPKSALETMLIERMLVEQSTNPAAVPALAGMFVALSRFVPGAEQISKGLERQFDPRSIGAGNPDWLDSMYRAASAQDRTNEQVAAEAARLNDELCRRGLPPVRSEARSEAGS